MSAHGGSARTSYWSIVFGQLRKNRIAVVGIGCIAALFAIAVGAPLLALAQPLVWETDDGSLSFPFVGTLMNRLLFPNAVDVFFNLLLLELPFVAILALALRRRVAPGRLVLGLGLLHLGVFALVVPESLGPLRNPLYHSAAIPDYSARRDAPDAAERLRIFPPVPYGYRSTDPAKSVAPPSREHWFGTDKEGRDVFARMVYGTRISLTIGVVAVGIYVAIGIVLGALAGYFGGWCDVVISRGIEVMICFPSFFLILTLAAFVQERSIFHVMVIIGITSWTGVARLIRAEFLKHKGLEYVQAAVALGIPRHRIIFGHILPNAIAPVLVTATFGVASAILVESSLAFLGLGDLSVPSWGETLSAGRTEQKLWLILVPGFAIFSVVSVFNLVGEGLRDALDPRLRT